jgi:hypothetical protein
MLKPVAGRCKVDFWQADNAHGYNQPNARRASSYIIIFRDMLSLRSIDLDHSNGGRTAKLYSGLNADYISDPIKL